MLLYPTKPSRRGKWCYCTLQNRHGEENGVTVPYEIAIRGKNGATVPYSNAIGDKNGATERIKTAAEAKMMLLSGSKPSRRRKWCY